MKAEETDTEYTATLFDIGWENAPHRVIRNKTIETWEKAGRPPKGKRPNEGEIVATAPNGEKIAYYTTYGPMTGTEGDIETLMMLAGQTVGLISDLPSIAEIITTLVNQAGETMKNTSTYVGISSSS